jgi:hypothetical protein
VLPFKAVDETFSGTTTGNATNLMSPPGTPQPTADLTQLGAAQGGSGPLQPDRPASNPNVSQPQVPSQAYPAASNGNQSVTSAAAPTGSPVSTQPMQTAFSLLLHSVTEKQQSPAEPATAPTGQVSQQSNGASSISIGQILGQNLAQQQVASAPTSADAGTRGEQTKGPSAASEMQLRGVSVSGGDSITSTSSAPSANSSGSAAQVGVATTISTATVNKAEPGGSNTNSKSNQEQSDDRQSLMALMDTSAGAPVANKFENAAAVAPSSARPTTEYVASQQTDATNTQANGSVMTDIRMQVEGAANQHVNVRVVQEADGVRVTVRSNDESLTQTLQDRLPDLTARLEQHHYQADVAMQRSVPGSSSDAGSGTNPQQESSGRQQSSGGQGNPQNRQNRQQEQTPEEEVFASLLGIRR